MNQSIATVIDNIDEKRKINGNTNWNVSKETGVFLNTLTRVARAKNVLEIGTSIGYSALWFADALHDTEGKLITVESHEKRHNTAKKHFEQAQVSHIITQVKGHAPECIADVKEIFDIIFFDATKMEHLLYWQYLAPKIKKGGMIITDNILSHKEELQEYTNHVQSLPDFQHSIIPIGTGLLLSLHTNR